MALQVHQDGRHIAVVTIDNQPKRNAMTRSDLADLAALWDRLDGSDCRCVVIAGAGEKGFCAGADIGGDLSASEATARTVNRALLKTSTFSKPIIAAVNGDCAGGGVELLLSTDIRLAAAHARFGLPEEERGSPPGEWRSPGCSSPTACGGCGRGTERRAEVRLPSRAG